MASQTDAVAVAQRHITELHARVAALELELRAKTEEACDTDKQCESLRAALAALEERTMAEQEAREREHAATIRERELLHGREVAALQVELDDARAVLRGGAANASVLAASVETELSNVLERIRELRFQAESRAALPTECAHCSCACSPD
jgi:chromosome segregation ATPase